jgi:predicted phage-related endonuclease
VDEEQIPQTVETVNPAPRDGASPLVTHFGDACEFTGVTDSNRDEWLAERQKIVTASISAAILGLDPRRDFFSVYIDYLLPPVNIEPTIASPMFWGKTLEQPILTAAAKWYGWRYHPGGALLRSRSHPHLGATLDAEIQAYNSPSWWVLEGKTTSAFLRKDWDGEDPPTRVLFQVQHQLMVTHAEQSVVFCLVGGNTPVRVDVHPDPELWDLIDDAAQDLLQRVGERRPPDATDLSDSAIKRLFPLSNGRAMMLPDIGLDWTRELVKIDRQTEELAKRRDALRNRLRQAIGDRSYGVLSEPVDDKRIWGYRTNVAGDRSLRLINGTTKFIATLDFTGAANEKADL